MRGAPVQTGGAPLVAVEVCNVQSLLVPGASCGCASLCLCASAWLEQLSPSSCFSTPARPGKAAGGKLVQASLAVDTCPFSSAGPKLEHETCQFLWAINLADSTLGSRVVQGTGVVIQLGFQSLSLKM